MTPRVLVTGSRTFDDADRIAAVLKGVRAQEHFADAVLVHGDARGADRLAAAAWISFGGLVEPHPAAWARCAPTCRPDHRQWRGSFNYCPTAGHRRNQTMVDRGADLCLVFLRDNSTGARDCRRRAVAADIHCLTFDYDRPADEGVWS